MEKNSSNKKLMITCKEATMLSIKRVEVKLPFSDRIRLFIHLLVCKYCRTFDKQIKFIDELLAKWKTDKKLSPEQKQKMQSEIEKELK